MNISTKKRQSINLYYSIYHRVQSEGTLPKLGMTSQKRNYYVKQLKDSGVIGRSDIGGWQIKSYPIEKFKYEMKNANIINSIFPQIAFLLKIEGLGKKFKADYKSESEDKAIKISIRWGKKIERKEN